MNTSRKPQHTTVQTGFVPSLLKRQRQLWHHNSFGVSKVQNSFERICLLILCAFVGVVALAFYPGAIPPSYARYEETKQIYWGVNIVGNIYNLPRPPEDMRAVYLFEQHANKQVSLINFGRYWQAGGVWQPFPKTAFDNIRNNGSIPVFTWGSGNGSSPNQPAFTNALIASGQYDNYIRQFAIDAKSWGHPFFLRFNWEMDGWWYPWGEGKLSNGTIVNGNKQGDYILAWNHVRDIFREAGATNVTWVWCVNHEANTWQYPPLSQIYPGDENVDWTAIDPYNRYDGSWLTFDQMIRGTGVSWMSDIYQKLLTVAPSKPIMLAEYASKEDPNDPQRKANWIRDAHLTQLPLYYPEIKAVLWYNDDGLQIESSANAQAAFAETINTSYFAANDFGNISSSPILPITQPIPPGSTVTPTISPTPTSSATPTISPTPTSSATPSISPTPTSSATPTPTALTTSGTVVLTPIADTFNDKNAPNTNYGFQTYLKTNGNPVQVAFLKFDLRTIAGKTINTVKLGMTTTNDASAGTTGGQTVKLVGSTDWSERYMTYNNSVTISTIVLGSLGSIAANTYAEIPLDMTKIQPKVGGLLSIAITATAVDGMVFSSREAKTGNPRLIINYR